MISSPAPRINSIDAVRATALLFILITHCVYGFWCGNTDIKTHTDLFCSFIAGKCTADVGFSMFSFLFGLGFFLQIDRSAKKGIDFRPRFCWRLVLLLGFACIDRLCYRGDILALFAIMGFIPVLLMKLATKWLTLLSAVCLIQPILLVSWLLGWNQAPAVPPCFGVPLDPTSASWCDIAQWNLTTGLKYSAALYTLYGRILIVPGLFILGMIAGRLRLFETGISKLKKLILPLLLLWMAAFLLEGLTSPAAGLSLSSWARHTMPHILVFHWWRCILQMGLYICILTCVYELPAIAKHLAPLRAVGRCTLTGYISQNAIMCAVLYQWGLGLGTILSMWERVLIGLGLYIAQVIVASFWLKHFKYGPLEGIWRHLTRLGMKK